MKYLFILLSVYSVLVKTAYAEEKAPLEPPYSRQPQQEAPLEPPYSDKKNSSNESMQKKLPEPRYINEDTGSYFYKKDSKSDAVYYNMNDEQPINNSLFMRFGTIDPFPITNEAGISYEDLYKNSSSAVVYFEYEWRLADALGDWDIKLGTGLTFANGAGRFSDPTETRTPKEEFIFVAVPNTVMLSYKMRFSDTQWFTPYIEGGAGYMGFVEHRDDGEKTSFGGAPFTAVAGGLLINLNSVERYSSAQLFENFGIHKVWLDLQMRRNIGLDDFKDFSSNMMTAGFGFAY